MRQACMIEFAPEVLRELLRLPEGVVVTGLDSPADRFGVLRARVEGMGWMCAEGTVIPLTKPILTVVVGTAEGDHPEVVSVDWGCPPPLRPDDPDAGPVG